MEMDKRFLFVIFCSIFAFSASVQAQVQEQSGFISIDCGIPEGSSYKNEYTGINYVSDAGFTDSGVNFNISSEIDTSSITKGYLTLRSFPGGAKSCYTLNPRQGKNYKYLIRASFLYGNYDNKSDVPRFDLYLGVIWWDTVTLDDESTSWYTEIMLMPKSDNIDICLVDTGFGAPFISSLELRLLDNNTYVTASRSLYRYRQWDYGSGSDSIVRFPDDVYDRFWEHWLDDRYGNLSVNATIESDSSYRLPSIIMETAGTPENVDTPIELFIVRDNPNTEFYVYMYFAEVEVLKANESREFNIYRNDEFWAGPVNPKYLQTTIIHSNSTTKDRVFYVTINRTANSTLPPLLNAYEVYYAKDSSTPETYQQDVEAILNIKSTYNVTKYWQGDPCQPNIAIWEGLNCSFNGDDPPWIISLNLSSSGLKGPISPSISKLTMLQYLDLSNNSLTGPVPDFLSNMKFLTVLNLDDNDLSGPIPQFLIDRWKNGSLSLSARENKKICSSYLCKHKFVVPLVTTIAAVFVLITAFAIFWSNKRRKQENSGSVTAHFGVPRLKERQFAYSEVLDITNNLEMVLGNRNSGTVYRGHIDDTPVAVKIFHPSYVNEYKQFKADARLITRVQHRHLTTSFGYFDDGNDKGLIYEFMPNRSLQDILSGRNKNLLSWQERLQIAMDIAQGLDYLHNGCKPPIIHGNLKPTNILLNENYQAKLVDFGLSKMFTIEPGRSTEYIDPEYFVTKKFTERSDVYSFGVALLAIITNREGITNSQEKTHLSQWVSVLIGKADIKSIIDPRLKDDFHIDSVWKAVEIAMTCVSSVSSKRPLMNQVVMELNQCLAMEITRINRAGQTVELVTLNLSTGLVVPQAR